MKVNKFIISALFLLPTIAWVSGCDTRPPEPEFFTKVNLFISEKNKVPTLQLEKDIKNSDKILAAFNDLDVPQLADWLIAAHKRGAEVRVVGDVDSKDQAGFKKLIDAGVTITFGDGAFSYLPDPNLGSILVGCGIQNENLVRCPGDPNRDEETPENRTMYRPGSMNIMSHNFILTGKTTVWNMSRGASSNVGGPLIGFRIDSERMYEVFEREHRQLTGGAFATNLDVYSGPTKSSQQNNPSFNAESYLSDIGEFKTMFNPQERLVKKVIDETYRSKASVWILTNTLDDENLLAALRYKAKYFDVRVIVNGDAQSAGIFEGRDKFVRKAPASFKFLPTIIVIDSALDRNDEKRPRHVMVLSHSLVKASPFQVLAPENGTGNDTVKIYTSDFFIDGNLWGISEYISQTGVASAENPGRTQEITEFVNFFDGIWNKSSKL